MEDLIKIYHQLQTKEAALAKQAAKLDQLLNQINDQIQ